MGVGEMAPIPLEYPQGSSIVGLLLFLGYINGASNNVLHSKIVMYTDNIPLYSIIKNPRTHIFNLTKYYTIKLLF